MSRVKKLDGGFRDTESSKKRRNKVGVGEAAFDCGSPVGRWLLPPPQNSICGKID